MATGNAVVDAILAGTQNVEVREAMLLGSDLESSWSATAVGDQGTSFGPFQLHEGGALGNLTPQQAEDPATAVKQMLGAYTSAVNSIPQSLWASNPELAAEEAAVKAERPAQSYFAAQGTATVNAKWAQTLNALKGIVSQSGPPAGGGSGSSPVGAATDSILGSAGTAVLNAIPGVFGLTSWKDLAERAGLILLGGALILLGIYMFAGHDASKIVLNVTGAGQEATKASQPDKPKTEAKETSSKETTRKSGLNEGSKAGASEGLGTLGSEAAEMAVVA